MGNWEKAIEESLGESLGSIDALNQDILARFKGLNSMADSLLNQVQEVSEYSYNSPVTRIDFARATGWNTNQGWGTKVTLAIPVPDYRCYMNAYASAQGYVYDTGVTATVDQLYNGRCRISIDGSYSLEANGNLCGPQGGEHWALSMTHSLAAFKSEGGSMLVNYDVYNGNTYQANQTDAIVGVITTFTRAV